MNRYNICISYFFSRAKTELAVVLPPCFLVPILGIAGASGVGYSSGLKICSKDASSAAFSIAIPVREPVSMLVAKSVDE